MSDRVGSAGHLCRSFYARLARTRQVQQPASRGENGCSPSQEGARCVPFKLARYGVGHGGSLAVGVFVIVGYVAAEVTGPSALLSLVVAALACLITGYCYAEYTSHYPTRSMPASTYHYIYMLSGEFPAIVVGWCQVLVYLAASALLGRAVSSTFDYIIGNPIQNFTDYALEDTAASAYVQEPDFLAFGVVAVVALLVSVGGKPASLSNAIFSVVSCVVVLALIVLAGIQLANQSFPLTANIFPEGHKGVFRGAAIFIFLFSSYDVISTSSKSSGSSSFHIAHALAISSIINLVFYLVLAMFFLLAAPFPWRSGNPFLTRLFGTHWGDWAKYTVGISAIVCLGSALFNNMCSLVYSVFLLGNDGLVFRFLGKLVSRLQSPFLSAAIFGIICGAIAIAVEQETLLELMALGLLAKQLIVCACTLSHRFQKIKLDVNENINLEDILKNGQVTNPGTQEGRKPVLSNGGPRHHTKRKTKQTPQNEEQSNADGKTEEDASSPAVVDASQTNGKSVRFRDETSDSSGASDIEETDIDAIVEEYQDRLRVASIKHLENPHNGRRILKGPTVFTSNMAAGFSVLVCLWTAVLAAILTQRVPYMPSVEPWTISGLFVFFVVVVVCLLVIVTQPRREVKPVFMTSLFPLLPFLGIAANVGLLFFLCAEAWIVFMVWLTLGLCVYFCYGICHSVEARRYYCRLPEEERILLPSIPEQAMHQEFVNGQTPKRQNIGYQDFHETP
ncbi:cationic amino acid transporter 4-like [Patiria miniata]|uniref:Cationic amino acid transporter C-terminal domain-containing protein n=1 Tax=Patiria miniata TaxID=46514 RepID=A0A914BQ53_PATMI|nr:cationic amino acid transporter 4-like [Patiria miniata]